jgi:starch synthase
MKILSVASEIFPLVKTGGLADVVGALPAALAREGVETRSLVPGYPAVMAALDAREAEHRLGHLFGGPARLVAGRSAGLDLIALDAPHLFERPGSPYADAQGREWLDNAQRFAALGLAAVEVATGALGAFVPDVVHAHDWQAGLVPAYLRLRGAAGPLAVVTIHNLAFQGLFPAGLAQALRLPPESLGRDGVEFYGQIGFLKAGLWYADAITTVSPTYAAEIRTPEHGMGLDGLLRARTANLHGIRNGIDTEVWNPASDAYLPATYTAVSLESRAANKTALQARLGLVPRPEALLFGIVSRLSRQKGLDLVLSALDALAALDAQVVLLGAGDADLEAGFTRAAAERAGAVGVRIGYDEALAHLIQGGCDVLLVPSRFEPCGLTQLCALRYGAVPVVARVGGLADTVIDANVMALQAGVATGVQFLPVTPDAFASAIHRVGSLWRDGGAWRQLQRNGMAADVGWAEPARAYASLYRDIVGRRGRPLQV